MLYGGSNALRAGSATDLHKLQDFQHELCCFVPVKRCKLIGVVSKKDVQYAECGSQKARGMQWSVVVLSHFCLSGFF